MGISKSGRAVNSAPNRAAVRTTVRITVRTIASAFIACALTAMSSSVSSAAPTDVLSPFPELAPQEAQDRTTAPATFPAAAIGLGNLPGATEPATEPATLPAATAPSTAPFLASPPEHNNDEAGDLARPGAEIVPLTQPRGPLTFSFTGIYMYGPVRGIAQTPLGGKQHSTSENRPSFSAIGIDQTGIADGEIAVGISPHQEIFAGAQYIHMSGNGVLESALISDNVHFPARTQVHSNIRMDWYRLGYRFTFVLNTAANNVPDLTVTPYIDAFYWDYGYNLNGGSVGSAGRSLTKFGMQIGGTLSWRPFGGPLSVELSAAGFPQITQFANIAQESLILRYRFYQYHHVDFDVLLGVAFEQQELKDAKFPMPNHITAEFGPMLLTGLQVKF